MNGAKREIRIDKKVSHEGNDYFFLSIRHEEGKYKLYCLHKTGSIFEDKWKVLNLSLVVVNGFYFKVNGYISEAIGGAYNFERCRFLMQSGDFDEKDFYKNLCTVYELSIDENGNKKDSGAGFFVKLSDTYVVSNIREACAFDLNKLPAEELFYVDGKNERGTFRVLGLEQYDMYEDRLFQEFVYNLPEEFQEKYLSNVLENQCPKGKKLRLLKYEVTDETELFFSAEAAAVTDPHPSFIRQWRFADERYEGGRIIRYFNLGPQAEGEVKLVKVRRTLPGGIVYMERILS